MNTMRYKEFNRNNVLEKCIPLFWKNGFNACSINTIVEQTKVNRFSLYQEFQNKEGILYASLQLYINRYASTNLEQLKNDGPVEDVLREFYLSFLQTNSFNQQGCYVLHIGTELADTDEDVKAFLKDYLHQIELLFINLLEKNTEFKAKSQFYAKHLIGLFCTSVSFCLIHEEQQRLFHINNSIQIILNKNK